MTPRLTAAWLDATATRAVTEALAASGIPAYFVGGCVRNALLGAEASDLDLATPARPEAVLAAADRAGLRAVPTGLAHGTVTLVADGAPFEVTTFRRDLSTDGRHAEVAFSERLEEDASRRDFTMNAVYATPGGTVIDPVGGLDDIAARRLVFIGAPADRIAEDYLRILRFFRFYAWYADPARGFDPAALAACRNGAAGLSRVSAERVGHEMRKLLAARDPAPALSAMAGAGILARVLPGAHGGALPALVALERGTQIPPEPLRRLAALAANDPRAALRLSRSEARRLAMLAGAVPSAAGEGEIAWRHGADAAWDVALLRAARQGATIPDGTGAAIARGAAADFPVAAADLPHLSGPALGRELARLQRAWIASDFALGRDALLAAAASSS